MTPKVPFTEALRLRLIQLDEAERRFEQLYKKYKRVKL
jgi:hypothetical protein